jgi:SPP1 family predicted phage head-tail adaptor
MRRGQLRHPIVIEQQSTSQDTMGGQVTTWTTLLTTRAAIEPMSAIERGAAQSIATDVTHQITVAYHPLLADPILNATRRVKYGSRYFNIRGTLNVDERNRVIMIEAGEGLARIA